VWVRDGVGRSLVLFCGKALMVLRKGWARGLVTFTFTFTLFVTLPDLRFYDRRKVSAKVGGRDGGFVYGQDIL